MRTVLLMLLCCIRTEGFRLVHNVRSLRSFNRVMAMSGAASAGDAVRVKWSAWVKGGPALERTPLPTSADLFDQGNVRFVVDAGGFMPCLHRAVSLLNVGEVSPDAKYDAVLASVLHPSMC